MADPRRIEPPNSNAPGLSWAWLALRAVSVVLIISIASGVVPSIGPASAQPVPYLIAGKPVTCTDFRGRSVVTMAVAKLGDVGFARVINTVPYILMDPEVLQTLPPKLQIFFFSHECAHHVLGHWFNPTAMSEREADCWAVQKHRDSGDLTRQEVKSFEPWLRNSRGSAWGHLPGPERAKHLLTCFDDAG